MDGFGSLITNDKAVGGLPPPQCPQLDPPEVAGVDRLRILTQYRRPTVPPQKILRSVTDCRLGLKMPMVG